MQTLVYRVKELLKVQYYLYYALFLYTPYLIAPVKLRCYIKRRASYRSLRMAEERQCCNHKNDTKYVDVELPRVYKTVTHTRARLNNTHTGTPAETLVSFTFTR